MKIAVYTIALNEEENAPKFMELASEADLVLVGDTGSTDNTKAVITSKGGFVVDIHVRPWRFDDARNAVLHMLPSDIDICFALDLDEFPRPGWRKLLENAWDPSEHTRLRFGYIHNFRHDGSPGTTGIKDFAHCRDGYRWHHIVHEKLRYHGGEEKFLHLPELVVEHRQTPKEGRRNYLAMLEKEASSPDTTDQHVFWLGREYCITGDWDNAIRVLTDYLERFKDKAWNVEVAHAYRYRARAYHRKGIRNKILPDFLNACAIAPYERELWLDLGWYYTGLEQWAAAYGCCKTALAISTRPDHYLTEPYAWSASPHDLAARCCWALDMKEQAHEHLKTAIELEPHLSHLYDMAKEWNFNDLGEQRPNE